jgi:hypothetical protein
MVDSKFKGPDLDGNLLKGRSMQCTIPTHNLIRVIYGTRANNVQHQPHNSICVLCGTGANNVQHQPENLMIVLCGTTSSSGADKVSVYLSPSMSTLMLTLFRVFSS